MLKCNQKLKHVDLGKSTSLSLETGQVFKGILLPVFEEKMEDRVDVRRVQFLDGEGWFIPEESRLDLLNYLDRNPNLLKRMEREMINIKKDDDAKKQ